MKIKNPFGGISGFPLMALAFLGFIAVLIFSPSFPADAQQTPLLEEKHKNTGITCEACHKEKPPSQAVPTAVCLSCHGSYSELVEKTKDVKPRNPHESHLGDLDCDNCHHVHKPSVNYCGECHTFGFKVP